MDPLICLRFDVDTRRDADALPRLLETLKGEDASATFFIATGRDLGRAQLMKRGGARLSPASVARYRTALASMVAAPSPALEEQAARFLKGLNKATELSLHGLNHGEWCEGAEGWAAGQTSAAVDEASVRFTRAFGATARGFAPPCFATNKFLRGILNDRGFAYVSDVVVPEGKPEYDNGSPMLTVPVTMGEFEEASRYPAGYGKGFGERLVRQARKTGFSCAYFHPSLVAHAADQFESLLGAVARSMVETVTMSEAARRHESGLSVKHSG